MVAPALTIYHEGSTPETGTLVSNTNKAEFLNIDRGIPSAILTLDVWNDKGGLLGSDTAVSPKFYAINGSDMINAIFAGTVLNNFQSMLEARSCAAYGTAADQQTTWTPISPTSLLAMGDLPSNCKRTIEVRVNAPIDAPDLSPAKNFILRVSA